MGREGSFNLHLFFQNVCSLRLLISATRFIALIVVCTNSRSYRTGILRRFSNSMVESWRKNFVKTIHIPSFEHTMVISFPAALRNALVHRTFRGLRFILSALCQFLAGNDSDGLT